MKLPTPPPQYDRSDESRTRSMIEQADAQNVKNGAHLIVKDTADGSLWKITVTSGTLGVARPP